MRERKAAAERVIRDFAAQNGFPAEWREEDRGNAIALIGIAPDGREYAVGYLKDARA